MRLVPRGTFMMGRVDRDYLAFADEFPRREATITQDYYMDVVEVTCAMWSRFDGKQPLCRTSDEAITSKDPVGTLPRADTSFFDALAYCRWVGCDLPTEAEFERAARGGVEGRAYPWGSEDDYHLRNAVGDEDGFHGVAPVGSFPPNGYGLFDMVGNVAEWCHWEAGRSPSRTDVPPDSVLAPMRGGSTYAPNGCRCSARTEESADYPWPWAGFRCVRRLPPSATCDGARLGQR